MPRTKALKTRVRELKSLLTPEQMKELSALLAEQASIPRINKREMAGLRRRYLSQCAHLIAVEDSLTAMWTAQGMTASEAAAELQAMRETARRTGIPRRGPRKRATGSALEGEGA